MRPPPPTYNLEQLVDWARDPSPPTNHCHTWGIFKEHLHTNNNDYWVLTDEHSNAGVRIKINNLAPQLPKPKPGYIVRIHRLVVDRNLKEPVVTHARNVIIWPSFKFDPTAVTTAAHPTLAESDLERRRQLEVLYMKSLYKVREFKDSPNCKHKLISTIGKITSKTFDTFGHTEFEFCDETDSFLLRVFKYNPQNPVETDEHDKVAATLGVGDIFVVTGAKLNNNKPKLDLSANLLCGRSLSVVEPTSIIGTTLLEALAQSNQPQTKASQLPPEEVLDHNSNEQPVDISPVAPKRPRRSPRLHNSSQAQTAQAKTRQASSSQPSPVESTQVQSSRSPIRVSTATGQKGPETPIRSDLDSSQEEEFPKYTQLAEIKGDAGYRFYNLVGQVRGAPNQTREHDNWVFQFYDGSHHHLKSYYADEVTQPIMDCVAILVYSPSIKFPNETDKHIKAVKELKEGDLVKVTNVRVQFKDGRVKFEMHSNLQHGKSIDVINKQSRFGMHIENKVTNPIFEDVLIDTQAETV